MAQSCPISFSTINTKGARVNALLTTVLLFVVLLTPYKWIIFYLAYDFFVRGFTKKPWSVLALISKLILKGLKQKPKMANAGPKIFAAKIGFVFCVAASICYVFSFAVIMQIFLSLFLVCAAMEGFFGFCVACQIYPLFVKR